MASDGVNVANAYVTILPSMQNATSTIASAIVPAAESAADTAGTSIGTILTGKLGKVAATIAGAFTAEKIFSGIMDVGEEFEDLRTKITSATGISGSAMDSMVEAAEHVTETVPTTLDNAGDIIDSLVQRMGLSGDTLSTVGEQIAAVEKMTGEAVDTSALTGDFNLFGVSAENVSGQMDTLYAIAQNTGISFNDLVSTLGSSGAAMNELGFDMTDTAEMAGSLSKSGLDASSMLSKMAKALPTLEENGESAGDAFTRLKGEMQDYIAQGNDSAALSIAQNLFGTRGATQFLAAVKSGSLDIEDLGSEATSASGTILETAQSTMTASDKWTMFKSKMSDALEPVASGLMEGLTDAMDGISDALGAIDPSTMQQLGEDLGGDIKEGIEGVTGALTWIVDNKDLVSSGLLAFGTGFLALQVAGTVAGFIQGFSGATTAATAAQGAFNVVLAANPIALVVIAVAALVAGLAWFFTQTETGRALWAQFTSFLGSAWAAVQAGLSAGIQAVGGFFSMVGSDVMSVWDGVVAFFTGIPGAIVGFFTSIPGAIGDFFSQAASGSITFLQPLIDWFGNLPGNIVGFITGIPGAIGDLFSQACSSSVDFMQPLLDFFSNLPQNIWDFISSIPGKFADMFSQIHVPSLHVDGSFNLDPTNFSLPTISFYANGAWADTPTLGVFGDAGGETVLPDSHVEPIVAQAIEDAGGRTGGDTYVIDLGGTTINSDEHTYNQLVTLLRPLVAQARS